MNESAFIAALRAVATDPAARGLADDAAVLGDLVLTHDMIVEGVHYLAADPPEDVAWKLVAVNLSDLAAKGATPLGVLLGYPLAGDSGWDRAFIDGLEGACRAMGAPLLGGDTVRMPSGSARALGLTAIGRAPAGGAPSRSGAVPGDDLWATGTIGDGGLGLAEVLRGGGGAIARRYRRPTPRLAAGQALSSLVSAMCDVSDGLLIDASRIAAASGVALAIELTQVPLSVEAGDMDSVLTAVTAGDDYELLFAAPPAARPAIEAVSARTGLSMARIGSAEPGAGLRLTHRGRSIALPSRLGFEHG